jgi:polar amino acid transport system substrate-binding protein
MNETIAVLHGNGFLSATWQKWFGHPMLYDPKAAPPTTTP